MHTLSRSSQDQMIYPRRGSAFSLAVKLTPPYSLFKPDNFWEISNAEKLAIRDDIAEENPGLTEEQIMQYTATEIESRENAIKYKFIEYHKWTFNSAWYTSLIGNLVLAAKPSSVTLAFTMRLSALLPLRNSTWVEAV